MCIVTIFISSDLRKAVPYQNILQKLFTGDGDLLVEINESIRNFISKEDLTLSQYSNQPEEKRPRLDKHLTNQQLKSADINKSNDSTNVQMQSNSTISTPTQHSLTSQIITINPFNTKPFNIKKEKDINFGTAFCASSESILNNQNSANNYSLVEDGQSSLETSTLPSTSGLNSYLLQSSFGTVSSSELSDLPPQILEKINFFSQDNQSILRSQSKSSDLLNDRGGNICNFLLSKETAPGIQI